MAGISINRRRKAWIKGVVAGATGAKTSHIFNPVLQAVFKSGLAHGQSQAQTPAVKAILDQVQRRQQPRPPATRSVAPAAHRRRRMIDR